MSTTSHQHIIRCLREISWLLSLRKEDFFRSRAYGKAADALARYDGDLDAVIDSGAVARLSGVGAKTAKVVGELHQTGRSHVLSELRKRFPRDVAVLARVPGLGLARLQTLHQTLGIESVPDLRAAVRSGRLAEVRGFGPATVTKIERALVDFEEAPTRLLLPHARALAARLIERWSPLVGDALQVTGALRRRREAVEQLELVAASDRVERPDLPGTAGFSAVERPDEAPAVAGLRGWRGLLPEGVPVIVWLAPAEVLGAALLVTTGPSSFAAEALSRATVYDAEAALLDSAGLAPWPPELRDAYTSDRPCPRLVEPSMVRGLVHAHTTDSDGRDDLRALARGAKALGYEYLTITDHSPSAQYARGLSVERLQTQGDQIRTVEEEEGIRILRGTESDIRPGGGLDHPIEVLEQLDVVIASIHGQFRLDKAAMTERLLATFESSPVRLIWGHPLGRLILTRPPIDADLPRVLDAIAARGHILEVNGDPHRMDLPPAWIREAKARGIPFVLSADAHSVRGLQMMGTAVDCGRAGGLAADDVLNTRDVEAFVAAARPRR